jgi:hypothetical protein
MAKLGPNACFGRRGGDKNGHFGGPVRGGWEGGNLSRGLGIITRVFCCG